MENFTIDEILPGQIDRNASCLFECMQFEYGTNNSCIQNCLFSNESVDNSVFFQSSIYPIANFILQFAYAITFMLGLFGNSLVISVIPRFSMMQTVTNIYIFNLAIADELFIICIPFLIVTSLMNSWIFGSIACKLYFSTTLLSQFTSSLFVTILSADRFIDVCQPACLAKYHTPTASKIVSVVAWIISFIMVIPFFIYSNTAEVDGVTNCNIFWPDSYDFSGHCVFTLYSFILTFGIPIILIFFFNVLAVQRLTLEKNNDSSREEKKKRRKVTKMVLVVITTYIICWLPYWELQLLLTFSPLGEGQGVFTVILFSISSCLTYVNSAINPFLYGFLNEDFKKCFIEACNCLSIFDFGGSMAEDGGKLESGEPLMVHRSKDEGSANVTKNATKEVVKENGPEKPTSRF